MTSTIVAGRNSISDHTSAQRDKHLAVKENPGKQLGAALPHKTPRKVLGDIKNSSQGSLTNSTHKAGRAPVLGTPKPGLLPARDSTSKRKERGRGGGMASASKVPPQLAHDDLSELEHMAPPELDKPDVFTVPSYVKALRSFRPSLPVVGRRRATCDTAPACPLPEPTRPKEKDEPLFLAEESAPPISSAHLPDLAELDLLLNNL